MSCVSGRKVIHRKDYILELANKYNQKHPRETRKGVSHASVEAI